MLDHSQRLWLIRGGLLSLILVAFFLSLSSPVWTRLSQGKPIQGLLLGCDWVDHAIHTDTMVFFSYNPQNRLLNLLAIPRDTQISSINFPVTKINQVYAYVYKKTKSEAAAAKATLSAVGALLGDATPSLYLQVGYSGFKDLVDLIGGLKVKIEQPMDYDDNWGNLHIHFSPGTYSLDGQKALEYVRYRDSQGDRGRILRQQRFLKNFLNKLKNPWLLCKLPAIISLVEKNLNTNLSWIDFSALIYEAKSLDKNNIQVQVLPGKPMQLGKVSYWVVDQEKINKAMNLVLAANPVAAKNLAPVQIEVWNASSQPGAARQSAALLRQGGFDVIKWGNLGRKEASTIVVDLIGNFPVAQTAAKIVGTDNVVIQIDPAPMVDIIVILGEDYAQQF